tara:strand:- start:227 stop:892 length:666 start_codon:yes stop_codon:yes gene_type:complete
MKKILLLLFLIQLIPAISQEIQSNAWNAFFGDFSLTSSTTIRTEIHYRSVNFYSNTDQILFRPQIRFKIVPGASLTAGYTYVSTNAIQGNTVENNTWQQFGFILPLKKLRFFGWIRAEQRFVKIPGEKTSFGHRIRFRSGFGIPLLEIKRKKIELIIFNEVFMNFKEGFPYNFNQNWTLLGFEKKLSNRATLLSGFQRTSVNGKNGYINKNIWSTIMFYKL